MGAVKHNVFGRRERNKLNKLRRIKDAAAELFNLKGYDDTTIREVAARADVGLGTVFVYVATKRDLLFLTVNEDLECVVNKAAEKRRADRPMLDELLRLFRGYYVYFAQEPALSRLSLREMAFYASGPEAQRFQKMRDRVIELIDDIVSTAIDSGEILTVEKPGLITSVIFAIYQVEVRRWLSSDELTIKRGLLSLRKQLELFVTGLSPRERA